MNTAVVLPLHAAELFIVQAVRRFINEGSEFQAPSLFEVVLVSHGIEASATTSPFVGRCTSVDTVFAAHGPRNPQRNLRTIEAGLPVLAATTVRMSAQVLSLENHL
jgi:hypothetical protein